MFKIKNLIFILSERKKWRIFKEKQKHFTFPKLLYNLWKTDTHKMTTPWGTMAYGCCVRRIRLVEVGSLGQATLQLSLEGRGDA